jgi:transposase
MSNPSYFVGVDVSKPFLDVHRLPENVARRFDNSAAGHRRLVRWLSGHPVGLIVMEASGGYEHAAVVALVTARLPVFVAQPQVIHAFARSLNQRAKNDQRGGEASTIDAAVLARYARDRTGDVTPLRRIDPVHEALAAQVMRRNQLVETHTREQNRIQQTGDAFTRKSIRRSLAWLEREIARVEKTIDAAIAADPTLAKKSATLQQTQGVGPQTTRTLVARGGEASTMLTRTGDRPPQATECAGGGGALRQRLRRQACPASHRRRPKARPQRVVHGRLVRQPLQPGDQGLLPVAVFPRPGPQDRPHGLHPPPAGPLRPAHPQADDQPGRVNENA